MVSQIFFLEEILIYKKSSPWKIGSQLRNLVVPDRKIRLQQIRSKNYLVCYNYFFFFFQEKLGHFSIKWSPPNLIKENMDSTKISHSRKKSQMIFSKKSRFKKTEYPKKISPSVLIQVNKVSIKFYARKLGLDQHFTKITWSPLNFLQKNYVSDNIFSIKK